MWTISESMFWWIHLWKVTFVPSKYIMLISNTFCMRRFAVFCSFHVVWQFQEFGQWPVCNKQAFQCGVSKYNTLLFTLWHQTNHDLYLWYLSHIYVVLECSMLPGVVGVTESHILFHCYPSISWLLSFVTILLLIFVLVVHLLLQFWRDTKLRNSWWIYLLIYG